jgi:hypothetical protein
MDATESELGVEITPKRRIPTRFGFHEPPHDRGRRGLAEEAAQDGAEFALLGREGVLHGT